MYPVLFQYKFITIHTYGFLVALAFYLSVSLAARTAEKEGIDPEKFTNLGLYIIISAILGARVFFVAINYKDYIDAPLRILKVWEGGLVFYGGFIFAVPTAVCYVRKQSLPTTLCADIIAPYISLGQAIGRLGCFFAGCCYGKPSECPLAVVFTHPLSLAPLNISLHPVQIYASFLNFSVFLTLRWLYKRKSFNGQVFSSYMIIYSISRFIIELFRSDERGSIEIFHQTLSTSQLISVLILIAGIISLFFTKKAASKKVKNH